MEEKYKIDKESLVYSLLVIDCYHYITKIHKEYVLSKQFLRSGTSIGANIMEAQEGQSKKDFLHKMSISLKEARESQYRLSLLEFGGYLVGYKNHEELTEKTKEMLGVLTKIVKTTKLHLKTK